MSWKTDGFQWKNWKMAQTHDGNIGSKVCLSWWGFRMAILLDYRMMSFNSWLGLLLIPCLTLSKAGNFDQLNEATGVNQTLDEGFGARHSGMAISFAGFHRDADAIANAPAAMTDIDDFTFSSAHAEKFGEAKFDNIAFLLPFEAHSTLGLGISRYGISGIDLRPEGSSQLQSQAPEVFSVADYMFVTAFARRWAGLDVGFNFNLIYRQLDQDGIGMRGDAMAQYTWWDDFRLAVLFKGLIPSSAAWESGYSEYEPSDIYLGAAARFPTPYFYGSIQLAVQSEGLFQKQARAVGSLKGDRLYESPKEFLSTLNLGAEYLFDFGLACRFGLQELAATKDFSSIATFGIGYNWRQRLGLDYSFTPHPDLLSTHRISIQFTPVFPKFSGKGFRPQKSIQNLSSPIESNPSQSPPSPSTPEIKSPLPGLNQGQGNPAKPNNVTVPEAVKPTESMEILEEEDEETE
jgi:hypothetical protein